MGAQSISPVVESIKVCSGAWHTSVCAGKGTGQDTHFLMSEIVSLLIGKQ